MQKKDFSLAVILLASLLPTACKKSGSGNDTITYEVKITSGTTWSGDYFDYASGGGSLKFVNHKPDGWKYSFTIAHGQKADLVLSAMPDNSNGSITATANIYQNGKIIATDSNQYGANAEIEINQ